MANLPTNYVDDVLDTSVNPNRKFRMINNGDGTVSFEDVTVYSVEGSNFGATDINRTHNAFNAIRTEMDSIVGAKIIEGITPVFSNNSYTYSDDTISADTLAMIFWTDASKDLVVASNIIVNTVSGGIQFTCDSAPSGTVSCTAYIFGESEE